MVHSESSGDARPQLSWGNSGRSPSECGGISESVSAGHPSDYPLPEGVSGSAEEQRYVPRFIPRESHGQDHGRRYNGLSWPAFLGAFLSLALVVGFAWWLS